jgi:uncharacterized metal-binding protein
VKRNDIFAQDLLLVDIAKILTVSLLINYVSFRILLIAKLLWNMKTTIIDIETAFSHENLGEEIYMDLPSGLDVENNQKSILSKTIKNQF